MGYCWNVFYCCSYRGAKEAKRVPPLYVSVVLFCSKLYQNDKNNVYKVIQSRPCIAIAVAPHDPHFVCLIWSLTSSIGYVRLCTFPRNPVDTVLMVGNNDWRRKTLKRMYPGVRGRLVDLCKPTQRKYNVAVTTAAGTVSYFLLHIQYILLIMFVLCLTTKNSRFQKVLVGI